MLSLPLLDFDLVDDEAEEEEESITDHDLLVLVVRPI
jgi:hypothetical protein